MLPRRRSLYRNRITLSPNDPPLPDPRAVCLDCAPDRAHPLTPFPASLAGAADPVTPSLQAPFSGDLI
jgi:hypothetical protein